MQEFETRIKEHLSALYRTALRMTRNEQDAEDLVQEAVVKAFRYYNQFEKGTNFKAWIFRIMINTYINQYRKKVKEPAFVDFSEIEPIYSQIEKETVQFTAEELQQLKDHFSDEVSKALDRLAPEYRIVFLLNTIEEFSYQEIADFIHAPVGTVMSRLFRARKLLKEYLWNYAKNQRIIKERTSQHEMS